MEFENQNQLDEQDDEIPAPEFYFTVGQLMDVLKDMPKDLPVVVSGRESGYENFFHPMIRKLKFIPDNYYKYGLFQHYKENEDEGEVTFDAVLLARDEHDD